jgi:hypothetical protein
VVAALLATIGWFALVLQLGIMRSERGECRHQFPMSPRS